MSYTDMRFVIGYYDAQGNLICASTSDLTKDDGDSLGINGMIREYCSLPYDRNTKQYLNYASYKVLYKIAVHVEK